MCSLLCSLLLEIVLDLPRKIYTILCKSFSLLKSSDSWTFWYQESLFFPPYLFQFSLSMSFSQHRGCLCSHVEGPFSTLEANAWNNIWSFRFKLFQTCICCLFSLFYVSHWWENTNISKLCETFISVDFCHDLALFWLEHCPQCACKSHWGIVNHLDCCLERLDIS
jgi:hypothetical protein